MIYTLNAPLFDLLVLSVISRGDTYGYQISQILKQASHTKDSTLYPVLRRLQENSYVLTYDQQYQGRNRKYYSITPAGQAHYEFLCHQWQEFTDNIDSILKGEFSHDEK